MHILLPDASNDPAETLAQGPPVVGACVTVGVFDGVHRGHQRLISDMAEVAHAAGNAAVLLTFDPHPATVLGYDPPALLTTVEGRISLLARLPLDLLVVLPFASSLAHTSARDFIRLVDRRFHLVELWGGRDLALGRRREGDIPFLRRLGREWGFSLHIVEPVVWEGEVVNSSRVRAALRAGDIREATGCLGRPYRLSGVAEISGGGKAARLSIPPERLVPAHGLYAGTAQVDGEGTYQARISIRQEDEGEPPTVEASLLDWDAGVDGLVGRELTLDLTARL